VFALVSGLGGAEWGPVHRFCESQRIPCLLPNLETPPDAGEDFPTLAKTFPAPPASAGVVITDGFAQLSEAAFMNDFANGVEPRVARQLYAAQAPNVVTLTTEKTTTAAWRSKPSWYAVSKQDRTINPELERFLAKRMNATTIEVDSGHLSLVSHPLEITSLILAAAGRDNRQP